MSRGRPSLVAGALLLLAGAAAYGHVRLRHPSNGNELFWPTPEAIPLTIGSTGSDDLSPGGHETALRNAMDAWNGATGQSASFLEVTDPSQRARTDWESDDLHLVFFDETNETGWFPQGTGAVAITPVFFFSGGALVDADVIFNGRDFQFTTSGQAGRFDVQDIAAHELGHFLGLDHSGWAGSTMYPFVDPQIALHRSLSWDEVTGLRDAYPTGDHAALTGDVLRAADMSPVAGAHVVARDPGGRTRASTLSQPDGAFALRGLAGGTYELYATPLDQPVSATNLGTGWVIETNFATTELGAVAVSSGQELPVGDLLVGSDVDFGLGTASDRLPLRGVAGTISGHVLGGLGLVAGSTLSASDPSVMVNASFWGGSSVQFQLTVPASAAPGHVDLVATGPAGERSTLVAAIEITPPDPVVGTVSPSEGPRLGGTTVTLQGSGFRPGARVVMGGEIYVDGEPGGADVLDDTRIRLTTRASLSGPTDVVVIDATGVEGRALGGFDFRPVPAVESVFPPAGNVSGGTPVVVRGQDFLVGVTVEIGGVAQSVERVSSQELVIAATQAGPGEGAALLEVENPGGDAGTASFDFVAAPDPVLTEVTPAAVGAGGGAEVTLAGLELRPGLQVVFGADPATGAGGASATATVLEDATALKATTPAHPPGTVSVLVRDPATGQAAVLPEALTFQQDGGGGCHAVPVDRVGDPLEAAAGVLGLMLLAIGVRLLGPRPRAARAG